MATFKIVRTFMNGRKYTVHRGLTKEEAKEHCRDPETSSDTATSATATARTRKHGKWFDGFDIE